MASAPQPVYVLRGVDSAVHSLKFLSPGILISGSLSGTVNVWDLKTLRTSCERKQAHGGSVLSFIRVSSGSFWSHGRDGKVRVWSIGESGLENSTSVDMVTVGFCRCCSIMMADKPYVCGAWGGDGEVGLVDPENGHLVSKFKPKQSTPCGMCMSVQNISGDGCPEMILTAHEDGTVRTWDPRNTSAQISSVKTHSDPIFNCAVDAAQRRGVVAGAQSSLVCISYDTAGELTQGKSVDAPSSGVTDLSVRSDSKLLLSSLSDGRLMAYSWKTLKTLAVMPYHRQTAHCVTFAPAGSDQHVFAAGGKDCTVSLWSLYK